MIVPAASRSARARFGRLEPRDVFAVHLLIVMTHLLI
jgi:hypothetical protein